MSDNARGGQIMGLLHILFTILAAFSFLGGMGLLIYQTLGFLMGSGWVEVPSGLVLTRLFGPAAIFWTVTAILNAIPLALALMVLGVLFNKIGDGFEKLGRS
jgi:hypothetical protein